MILLNLFCSNSCKYSPPAIQVLNSEFQLDQPTKELRLIYYFIEICG